MSKEASRIRRVISGLRNREDIAEIVEMAKVEIARGVACRELSRYERGVAIYRVAREALGNAGVRGQLPRYTQAF